jgi:hypothetical protein
MAVDSCPANVIPSYSAVTPGMNLSTPTSRNTAATVPDVVVKTPL